MGAGLLHRGDRGPEAGPGGVVRVERIEHLVIPAVPVEAQLQLCGWQQRTDCRLQRCRLRRRVRGRSVDGSPHRRRRQPRWQLTGARRQVSGAAPRRGRTRERGVHLRTVPPRRHAREHDGVGRCPAAAASKHRTAADVRQGEAVAVRHVAAVEAPGGRAHQQRLERTVAVVGADVQAGICRSVGPDEERHTAVGAIRPPVRLLPTAVLLVVRWQDGRRERHLVRRRADVAEVTIVQDLRVAVPRAAQHQRECDGDQAHVAGGPHWGHGDVQRQLPVRRRFAVDGHVHVHRAAKEAQCESLATRRERRHRVRPRGEARIVRTERGHTGCQRRRRIAPTRRQHRRCEEDEQPLRRVGTRNDGGARPSWRARRDSTNRQVGVVHSEHHGRRAELQGGRWGAAKQHRDSEEGVHSYSYMCTPGTTNTFWAFFGCLLLVCLLFLMSPSRTGVCLHAYKYVMLLC